MSELPERFQNDIFSNASTETLNHYFQNNEDTMPREAVNSKKYATNGHLIKNREVPLDVFYTPLSVVKQHLLLIDAKEEDKWFDPFFGEGIYYDNFPTENKCWTEINKGKDFFEFNDPVDIICSNPPFSMLDKVFKKSVELKPRIISYLIGVNNLTPKRIEDMNRAGYGLSKCHMLKVKKWFGMQFLIVFEKGATNCMTFDRKVHDQDEDTEPKPKSKRKCSICRKEGHTKNKCPDQINL